MLDIYWDVFEPENMLFHWSHPALNKIEGWVTTAPCHWLVAYEERLSGPCLSHQSRAAGCGVVGDGTFICPQDWSSDLPLAVP